MDVSVAIIQLRRTDRTFLSPHDYDVVILDEPSTSYNVPKHDEVQPYPVKKRTTVGGHRVASTVIKLPSFRVTDCTASLADSVLSELATKTRAAFRRAVAIPLWDGDGPSSSGRIAPGTVLMCAPMVPKGCHVALFLAFFSFKYSFIIPIKRAAMALSGSHRVWATI